MKLDKNLLKEIIETSFKYTEGKERKFKGYRGCITFGHKDIMDFSHCGDITCPSCNLMKKALEDEILRATFKFYDNDNFRSL